MGRRSGQESSLNPWDDQVFVIAEAGVNHNGDESLALRLIDAAVSAGANAVKFQAFNAEALATRDAPMATYQQLNTGVRESQYSMLKKLELPDDAFGRLALHAQDRGIVFFATAFDSASIEMLRLLKIPIWKVPSGEINNYPYLRKIGACGTPLVVSTGMACLSEVEFAVTTLEEAGTPRKNICLMHCTTEYPAPWNEVNLRAMLTMRVAFGTGAVGYSDHTLGSEIAIAAVALGARVIEKHFTLDRDLNGPDHKASLAPDELTAMISAIRHTETALGDGIKRPTASETETMAIARKSIVAAISIRSGQSYTEANLAVKRPGTGISPSQWLNIIGRKAPRDFEPDEPIEW
jgi:N,N'-diacetyllegionaminate synthase